MDQLGMETDWNWNGVDSLEWNENLGFAMTPSICFRAFMLSSRLLLVT